MDERNRRLVEWFGFRSDLKLEDLTMLGSLAGLLLSVLALTYMFALAGAVTLTAMAIIDGTTDDLRNIAFFLAAVLGAPFVVWRALIAQSQAETGQRGLITERFTTAVEQLAHDKPYVRAAGIYALERIGRDDPDEGDVILSIVNAYMLENGDGRWESVDVRAALQVIGRRSDERNSE